MNIQHFEMSKNAKKKEMSSNKKLLCLKSTLKKLIKLTKTK